jgi:hypothetical protein
MVQRVVILPGVEDFTSDGLGSTYLVVTPDKLKTVANPMQTSSSLSGLLSP